MRNSQKCVTISLINNEHKREPISQFGLCLNNEGYAASLKAGKVYRVVPDNKAAVHGYIRVIDESGEDYAYATNRFHLIQLSMDVENVLLSTFIKEI